MASLVFGILGAAGGFCVLAIPCLIAILTGHLAMNETRGEAKGGQGMAMAGLLLGYIFVLPWGFVGVAFVLGNLNA